MLNIERLLVACACMMLGLLVFALSFVTATGMPPHPGWMLVIGPIGLALGWAVSPCILFWLFEKS